jgi:hypothetical protein
MTNFSRDGFINSGGYVSYREVGSVQPARFVARFKYNRGNAGAFITFLIKNFTVEEYFGRYNKGETPLGILESKGYMQPHIKKLLKSQGYPVTKDGFNAYVKAITAASIAATEAKVSTDFVLSN